MKKLFGVIGDPIAQSLSPLIHKAWMRDYAIHADYLALKVPEGEFPDALQTLTRKGFQGLNITMPHKLTALEHTSELTERARKIGAVNTLWRGLRNEWQGDNTDAPGFLTALLGIVEAPLSGQHALVLGAGGAARAIVHALDGAGVKLDLANRTLSRAEALLALTIGQGHRALTLSKGLSDAPNYDFTVNTTSAGYSGESLVLPEGAGKIFYDISYGPASAQVLGPAQAKGWRTEDGLSMLVYQAAFAFERWFEIMPDAAKALKRCRAVLEMA